MKLEKGDIVNIEGLYGNTKSGFFDKIKNNNYLVITTRPNPNKTKTNSEFIRVVLTINKNKFKRLNPKYKK